jgi:regulator of replication initiation timing
MTNNNQNQNKEKNRNILPIAATVGVLLLCLIGYFAYNSITTANKLEQTVYELEESNKLREELETQYNQALADLESQKTTNEELNGIIDQQKAELESQKNKIAGLIRSKGKLDKARIEIENLKVQVGEYIAQIDQLKAENEALAGENAQLSEEKANLTTDLEGKIVENQELSEAKAQLVTEKEKLTKKVNVASVIKLREVKVEPRKVKGSGKAVSTSRAKSTDQIKVCFTTLSNEVVRPGMETFFVRIINPRGETLAIEDMGSGMLTNKKTGEEVRFTQAEEVDYSNDSVQACMVWAPTNSGFISGDYTVEVYNKGYLAGMGAFSLK